MFLSPNIEVHGHKGVLEVMVEGLLAVLGVKEAEEVPRRVNEGVHCVCFTLAFLATPVQGRG